MFQFLFNFFSNSDTNTNSTPTSSSTASSREYPFNIQYRTGYKKCWIDKLKK